MGGITLRPEVPRITANRRILGFVEFREFLCPFDKDTIALRLIGGIGCIWLESHEYAKIPSRFTRIYSEIPHESVKNTPKASTNQRKFVAVIENS